LTTVGLNTMIKVAACKYFANYLEMKTAVVWFECNPGSSRFNQTKCDVGCCQTFTFYPISAKPHLNQYQHFCISLTSRQLS
jgi:hypothetical protein